MNLLFFDIDGTLAIKKNVPESAERAIGLIRERGDLVFICSGRYYRYAEDNFGRLADGFVCCNGRLSVKNGQILHESPLTAEQIGSIRRRLDALGVDYLFFGKEDVYFGGDPSHKHRIASFYGLDEIRGKSPEEGDRVYNFDVFFSDLSVFSSINEALSGFCLLNPHGNHPSADVTILGMDKGDAIRIVAEKLGVPRENTYAFGDGVNDISMLEAAGHGIAMGNAAAETKEVAEYVTAAILEDGVAKGLRHYGLI